MDEETEISWGKFLTTVMQIEKDGASLNLGSLTLELKFITIEHHCFFQINKKNNPIEK